MASIDKIQVQGTGYDIIAASAKAYDSTFTGTDSIKSALDAKENKNNKITAWQNTPDNTHYPSEKLVNDELKNRVFIYRGLSEIDSSYTWRNTYPWQVYNAMKDNSIAYLILQEGDTTTADSRWGFSGLSITYDLIIIMRPTGAFRTIAFAYPNGGGEAFYMVVKRNATDTCTWRKLLHSGSVTSSYSSTGTAPVNGTAIAAALGTLDVSSVGGDGKYIKSISETNGKISATAETMDTTPTVGSNKAVASSGIATALDGKVPSGRKVNGKALSADITLNAANVSAIATSARAAANGVASLDANGKVPTGQLPALQSLTAGTDLKIANSIISVNTNGTVGNSADMPFVAGSATYAAGVGAAAFGWDTVADGDFAFAEGDRTTAYYLGHAEGQFTIANGQASHAEGYDTSADGFYSHTEGYETKTLDGSYATHAEGIETIADSSGSHAEGYATCAAGENSHAEGAGTRADGYCSHAEGFATTVSGEGSHAEGYATSAAGDNSHAEGGGTIASGNNSHAEGHYTSALNKFSHTEGYNTTTEYDSECSAAHAEGYDTKSVGNATHSEGISSRAAGTATHAEGGRTHAAGYASHAEGYATSALDNNAHAEGNYTVAYSFNSHAEGDHTSAVGENSHAEGSGTSAVGNISHAAGAATTASGVCSHSEGEKTLAVGDYSFALGYVNKAIDGSGNFVGGKWSTNSYNDYGFVYGEGNRSDNSVYNTFAAPVVKEYKNSDLILGEYYKDFNSVVVGKWCTANGGIAIGRCAYAYNGPFDEYNITYNLISTANNDCGIIPTQSWFNSLATMNPNSFGYQSANLQRESQQWPAIAIGAGTQSYFGGAVAIGLKGQAFGPQSFVACKGNYSWLEGQTVIGTWNDASEHVTNPIFVIGNGTGYFNSAIGHFSSCTRSTCFEIGKNGDVWTSGNITITNTADISTGTTANVPFSIGGLNSEHLEMDRNEIIVKAGSATTGTLYLQAEGGIVAAPTITGTSAKYTNISATTLYGGVSTVNDDFDYNVTFYSTGSHKHWYNTAFLYNTNTKTLKVPNVSATTIRGSDGVYGRFNVNTGNFADGWWPPVFINESNSGLYSPSTANIAICPAQGKISATNRPMGRDSDYMLTVYSDIMDGPILSGRNHIYLARPGVKVSAMDMFI